MIKSIGSVGFLGLAAICTIAVYPCQAQTTASPAIGVTKTNEFASPQSRDVANTGSIDPKNPGTTKSFTISEFNSTPSNSNLSRTTTQNQSARTNPLGCRFFDVPSMQQ